MFHWIGAPKWALAILAFTLAFSLLILSYLAFIRSREPLITYVRTGGFAGIRDVLTIYQDGTAYLQSRTIGFLEIKLTEEELKAVKLMLEEMRSLGSLSYGARQGAADFFSHSIVSDGIEVSWVDQWAAREELPLQLSASQLLLDKLIQEASGSVFAFKYGSFCGNLSIYVEASELILRKGEGIEIKVILENLSKEGSKIPPPNFSGECLEIEATASKEILGNGTLELTLRVVAECGGKISKISISHEYGCEIEIPVFVLGSPD